MLVGKVVKDVRPMTKAEMESEYWDDRPPTVIVFEDGTKLYPSRDEEGNGPGCLFGENEGGKKFALY